MEARTLGPTFAQVLGNAATCFSNLFLGGTAIMLAMLFRSWALLALGGATFVLLTTWRMASPSFWREAIAAQAAARRRLPDPTQLTDLGLRTTVAAINSARAEVLRVVNAMPAEVKTQIGGALGSLDELEYCAARLIARDEELLRYLRTVNRGRIADDIKRLGDLARRTDDAAAQREYRDAYACRTQQLSTLNGLFDAHERVSASLQRIIATIEAFSSQVVRVQVLSAEAGEDLTGELDQELDGMTGEMRLCEDTLTALVVKGMSAS